MQHFKKQLLDSYSHTDWLPSPTELHVSGAFCAVCSWMGINEPERTEMSLTKYIKTDLMKGWEQFQIWVKKKKIQITFLRLVDEPDKGFNNTWWREVFYFVVIKETLRLNYSHDNSRAW